MALEKIDVSKIMANYGFHEVNEFQLISQGLNDTYLVSIKNDNQFILRVYRPKWRNVNEINFELELLMHLQRKGFSLSTPISKKDGTLINEVIVNGINRIAVLFTFVQGEPFLVNEENSYLFGRKVAQFHTLTEDFQSKYDRFDIDLEHLIDRPLITIKPFLKQRPSDWIYLKTLGEKLKEQVLKLSLNHLDWGICHGDLGNGNVHFYQKNLTFFDFDCCGVGWRGYDIAVYRWDTKKSGEPNSEEDKIWEAFLKGYKEIKHLRAIDLNIVPLFVSIRQLWWMGLHMSNGDVWGLDWINDDYFDRTIQFLREWESNYLV
ncbi:phosphotransferase [Paenibacillus sp. FSL W7-1287]|uniref:phosphotransferase n=1 Tax=Paenibacillus sp. FSL W7-1287 TaxID=2954538 RepID=UPI0030FCC8DE